MSDSVDMRLALDNLRRAVDAWDNTLSSYCDGEERDKVRAASLKAARLLETLPSRDK